MKIKLLSIFLVILMLTGCSEKDTQEIVEETTEQVEISEQSSDETVLEDFGNEELTLEVLDADETVDYDLTAMSETMVFAQVYDVIMNPTNYDDTTFKIHGEYEYYTVPNSDEIIYFIVINDATGCCPQGLEIRFTEDLPAPEDFCEVIMKGTAYSEPYEGYTYIHFIVTEFVPV
ncbi:MAG: hypothetical protein R3Y09_09575 [Clostridia bacterium]